MNRVIIVLLMLIGVGGVVRGQQIDAQREAEICEALYGPTFYGISLPESGARVLLVIDTSKSMGRKDKARTDGGRRWDTLLDEVQSMSNRMVELIRERRVNFSVSLLYEGGDIPHRGSEVYDMAKPNASTQLLTTLSSKTFTSGGSFKTTFGETLWPLVAKQHITHIFYLGDNDIGKYAEEVRASVTAWYALPKKQPSPSQRKLWSLKTEWYQPWTRWRKPVGASRLVFKKQQSLPPPPKDVTFSCIAIGQTSPLLKELATLGNGEYVERRKKKK